MSAKGASTSRHVRVRLASATPERYERPSAAPTCSRLLLTHTSTLSAGTCAHAWHVRSEKRCR
eukprot:scaffold133503_cov48-Phaeocystis_antarctica.AAC.1